MSTLRGNKLVIEKEGEVMVEVDIDRCSELSKKMMDSVKGEKVKGLTEMSVILGMIWERWILAFEDAEIKEVVDKQIKLDDTIMAGSLKCKNQVMGSEQ